jgi:hypothetical protein
MSASLLFHKPCPGLGHPGQVVRSEAREQGRVLRQLCKCPENPCLRLRDDCRLSTRHGSRSGGSSACVVSLCCRSHIRGVIHRAETARSRRRLFWRACWRASTHRGLRPILVAAPGRLSIMNGRPGRSCGQFSSYEETCAGARRICPASCC